MDGKVHRYSTMASTSWGVCKETTWSCAAVSSIFSTCLHLLPVLETAQVCPSSHNHMLQQGGAEILANGVTRMLWSSSVRSLLQGIDLHHEADQGILNEIFAEI